MKNIKIQQLHLKRKNWRQTQFTIKRKNDDLEESQEQLEKLIANFRRSAPKVLQQAMKDNDKK